MGNNSKKRKGTKARNHQRNAEAQRQYMQQGQPNPYEGLVPPAPTATDEQRQQAVVRLVKAMKVMAEPPETVLSLLDRLDVPYRRTQNVPGDSSYDTLVIKVSDLEAGEARNQEQGSILKRLYGSETEERVQSSSAPKVTIPTESPEAAQKRREAIARERLQKAQDEIDRVTADSGKGFTVVDKRGPDSKHLVLDEAKNLEPEIQPGHEGCTHYKGECVEDHGLDDDDDYPLGGVVG